MLVIRQPFAETRYREEWHSFVIVDPFQIRTKVQRAVRPVSMRGVATQLAIPTNNAPPQLLVDGIVRYLSLFHDKTAH